jgi:hypothetical protein
VIEEFSCSIFLSKEDKTWLIIHDVHLQNVPSGMKVDTVVSSGLRD